MTDARASLVLAMASRSARSQRWLNFTNYRNPPPWRPAPTARWSGTAAGDRRLLLLHNEGFGDAIQTVRFVPEVRRRVGSVAMVCPAPLHDLLGRFEGLAEIIESPLPEDFARFDLCANLISLPRLLGIQPEDIRGEAYIAANAERRAAWRRRLPGRGRLRVGLVMAGNPRHPLDAARSCRSADIGSVLAMEDVVFYDLAQERQTRCAAPLGRALTTFDEAAGCIAALDLVISVDTAYAHLAGALGIPVWLLLARYPDARWLDADTLTPWYASMRLFRQRVRGDWLGVFAEVRRHLEQLVRARALLAQ